MTDDIAEMLRGSKYPNVQRVCTKCDEGQWVVTTHANGFRDTVECPDCHGSGHVPSAEEWAVHDYDGIPATFGEHPDLDDVLEFVKGVEEHGDAFRARVEHQGVHNFIHEDFQDKYAGEADSKREWAENFVEERGVLEGVPKNLRSYFDEERYVQDMELNGEISFVEFDGTIYAFWC